MFGKLDRMMVVYTITHLDGKIYIGQDRTDCINFLGSADSRLIAADLPSCKHRRVFTITREILWESDTATVADVNAVEMAMILDYRSNDPAIGDNRRPRFDDVGSPRWQKSSAPRRSGYQGGPMIPSIVLSG